MRSLYSLLLAVVLIGSGVDATAKQSFKIATLAPDGTIWMNEMRAAAKRIADETEGRVEVRYFPGGVQGNDSAVMRKIRLGQLQGGALTSSELTLVDHSLQLYGMPFVFETLAEADHVRGLLNDDLKARYEAKGFVIAGIAGGGFAYLMGTEPIDSAEQLRATKVWVPQGDEVSRVTFEVARVQSVVLSLGDVYTALQTGLVQTVGNTLDGALAFQWHTRVKHVLDLPVVFVTGVLALDKRAVDKLSAEDRALLLKHLDEAFRRIEAANYESSIKARASLEREGIRFVVPSAADLAAFREIGTVAVERIKADGKIAPELFAALEKALQDYRAQPR